MEALQTVIRETGPDPALSIIWLHGLGADGHDFEGIVRELLRPSWPSLRFVFPHAPVRAVTVNGGMRMRAWYDILGMDLASRQDEAGIRQSVAQIEQLIELELAAFLGAGYRVPLAGVMFVAETTGQPGFVVPGLIAAVAAALMMGASSITPYQRAPKGGD